MPIDRFGAIQDALKCPFGPPASEGRDVRKVHVRVVMPLQKFWIPENISKALDVYVKAPESDSKWFSFLKFPLSILQKKKEDIDCSLPVCWQSEEQL